MNFKLLISTSLKQRQTAINQLLKSKGISHQHPDLLYLSADDKIGIEQARKIKEYFSLKPYLAKGRMVILEDGAKLTDEAQNALLKTLEELPEDALFVIGVNSEDQLLPTILSRGEITNLAEDETVANFKQLMQDIEAILQASLEERFRFIENLKSKEKFLDDLIIFFHHQSLQNLQSKYTDFLKKLITAEIWRQQNVNIRAILEYLMLVMPNKE